VPAWQEAETATDSRQDTMDYRREIDGLRAVAVLPVILFHAGFETFSGGFVGVDVFFVISGYLITTIILAELEQGKFSIVNFYERRARRILPALFLVMFVCIPFAWLWLLPSDTKDFSQSLVAVTVFASNILFWRSSGYFDTAAELKPLLHTWSLAVEEQYYVLFPLFLMLFWKLGKRWILVTLGLVFVASLALAQWGAYANPIAAFFLLPTRGWELLIGAFAAFYLSKANRKDFGKGLSEFGGWLGLVLILYSVFAYSKTTPFPGFYALVPTLGTVLIILFGSKHTTVGKLVGNKIFVGIGLISYSAYLWHQPLFAFARHSSLSEPSDYIFLFLSLLTLILAYGSWKFVETPLRSKLILDRSKFFLFSILGAIVFSIIGFIGHKLNGFEDYYFKYRVGAADRKIISYLKYNEGAEFKKGYRSGTCFYGSQLNSFEYFDKAQCLKITPDKRNYLVLGDSHSAHLAEAFRTNFTQHNFLQASASGCRPVLPLNGEKRCTDLINFIYSKFLLENRLSGIILSARWEGGDIKALINTVDYLSQYVSNIYIIGPTVEYRQALPLLMVKLETKSDESNVIRKFTDGEIFYLSENLGLALKSTKAFYIPIIQEICSSSSCRILTGDGVPMSWDYGHFTIEGADYLIKSLVEKKILKFTSE
jgi:peptidoglycan/LPS O-acetylase OafA/YrhL